jgi:hypothetical protein
LTLRSLARRAGLGHLAYLGWHAPRGFAKRCAREGPLNLWLAARGRRAMEQAAERLPPAPAPVVPGGPAVYFLTGDAIWYQTAFCAWTLRRSLPLPVPIVILSDGTLSPGRARRLAEVIPGADLEPADAVEARLDATLPASRYPTLRGRRAVMPLFRKLTDVHAGRPGWRLFLDSDMLFFRRPAWLEDWLTAPARPCHMVDVVPSYGYSPGLMAELGGPDLPERLNSGVFGARSEDIDWDRVEDWCRVMLAREGTHYLQEQALTALLVARWKADPLPPADYLVRPDRAQARHPRVALHHYVAESKAWYFRYGWRAAEGAAGE